MRWLRLDARLQGIKVKDAASKKKALAALEARRLAAAAAMEED